MEGAMELRINGERKRVVADPEMPLLWVLRDLLGLTGSKYGCGIAECGTSTVLVDGEETRSCVTPVAEVEGRSITTIEGLAGGRFRALQEAWVESEAGFEA
jgi:isoquinoline 1-oxidoreductase alpha subunit